MARVPLLNPKSLGLLALAALLGLGVALPGGDEGPEDLPVLAEVDRDAVRRIELSRGQTEKLVIVGDMASGWRVVSPFEAEADDLQVRSLLKVFASPLRMDLRVDEGEDALETYLLDDQNAVVLSLFGEGDAPLLAVVVGGDMPGGSSFVRLPGEDLVYRARVGSRARLDRDLTEWRDKMVVQEDPEAVRWIELERGGERHQLVRAELGADPRGRPLFGPWVLVGDPEFPVDQALVEDIVTTMAVLRAGRALSPDFDGGFDAPAARVRFGLSEDRTHELVFGGRASAEGAFLKADGAPEVWLVGAARLTRALTPLASLRALHLFELDRERVRSLRLEDGGLPTELAPAAEGPLWEVVEPANVDADVRQIFFALNTLATLQADAVAGVGAVEAGLDPASQRIIVTLDGGAREVLEVGGQLTDARGRPAVYVRRVGDPTIYTLNQQTLTRLRQAFNRAN